jgi:hypothetical protein
MAGPRVGRRPVAKSQWETHDDLHLLPRVTDFAVILVTPGKMRIT